MKVMNSELRIPAKEFFIGGKMVGEGRSVFIIAEAGVAHFGSLEKALKLVDLAANAGADAIKFQIFKTDSLISNENQEWKKRLASKELPFAAFLEIQKYCENQEIMFMATAHDEQSLEFLAAMDVPVYKIGSGEVNNWSFFRKVASLGKPVIFSTGMYEMDEIRQAVGVLLEIGNRNLAVLHCVTSYPTPPYAVNLNAIQTIKNELGVITGYSDHTEGFHFPLAAVALGAKIIEKHISLDFDVPNAQDWKVSCGPDNFHLMVDQIRDVESGMGTGVKNPDSLERESLLWARKSLVASRDLKKGETIVPEMLVAKRPGTGISPADTEKLLGRVVNKGIARDTLLKWEFFK